MRSVSRPGRSRSLCPSVVSPCSAAHRTSVRVSTSRPPATLATASRSSANAADNWTGASSALNGNRVARVNIAWYVSGCSSAKLLYAWATLANFSCGSRSYTLQQWQQAAAQDIGSTQAVTPNVSTMIAWGA